jgi:hypothetical protein
MKNRWDRNGSLRNNEGSATPTQGLEAFLDQLFSLGINRTSGFIQKNDLRLLEDCASNSYTLLFASRQLATKLSVVVYEVARRNLHSTIANLGIIS